MKKNNNNNKTQTGSPVHAFMIQKPVTEKRCSCFSSPEEKMRATSRKGLIFLSFISSLRKQHTNLTQIHSHERQKQDKRTGSVRSPVRLSTSMWVSENSDRFCFSSNVCVWVKVKAGNEMCDSHPLLVSQHLINNMLAERDDSRMRTWTGWYLTLVTCWYN